MTKVWLEQKADLQSHSGMQQFNQRLMRRWAIETGIIERIYTLDRGITQVWEVVELCDEPFQVNNKEPQDEALERFRAWLDPILVKGLEMLRRSA